jgi:hypothetical protein
MASFQRRQLELAFVGHRAALGGSGGEPVLLEPILAVVISGLGRHLEVHSW